MHDDRDGEAHRRDGGEAGDSCRPTMAMTTVVPANSTAWPAVALAVPAASATRHALVQVLAVPGDDEQGVVDADAEADHHAERRRRLGHVDEAGDDADAATGRR